MEILFDKIIIFASCTHVTEVWELAQRRTRLTILTPTERPATCSPEPAGEGPPAGPGLRPPYLPSGHWIRRDRYPAKRKKERKGRDKGERGQKGKKKALKFGLRLFKHSNPFVLMGPGAAGAGTGPWNGKI